MDVNDALNMARDAEMLSDGKSLALTVLAREVVRLKEQSEKGINELPLVQADNRNRVSLSRFTERKAGSFWAVEAHGADEIRLTAVELVPVSMLGQYGLKA